MVDMQSQMIEPQSAEDEAYLEPVSPEQNVVRSSYPQVNRNAHQASPDNGFSTIPKRTMHSLNSNMNDEKEDKHSVLMRTHEYDEHAINPYSYSDETNNNNDSNTELVMNNSNANNLHRRKSNPLYISSKRSSLPQKSSSNSICSISFLFQILTLMIAVAALLLAIFNGKSSNGYNNATPEGTISRIIELQNQIDKLNNKSVHLVGNYSSLIAAINNLEELMREEKSTREYQSSAMNVSINRLSDASFSNLTLIEQKLSLSVNDIVDKYNIRIKEVDLALNEVKLNLKEERLKVTQQINQIKHDYTTVKDFETLETSYNEFTINYNLENNKMQQKIDDVEKMPGPKGEQGPSGAGNLTLCSSNKGTSASSSPISGVGDNAWVILNPDRVATGVYCSYVNAKWSTFEMTKSNGLNVYTCTCSKTIDNTKDKLCYIEVWHCPKFS